MELSTTLLVALMYSTIISISLGGMLALLADTLSGGLPGPGDRLYIAWFLFLLVLHLNMFWNNLLSRSPILVKLLPKLP